MPELPEVETTRQGILPFVKNKTIAKVIIRNRSLRFPIPPNIEKILQGKTISDVLRRGKYLLLITSQGTILIHLGMSGHLRILNNEQPVNKHDHIDIIFKEGHRLRFTDPRRFGVFLWMLDHEQHPLIKHLGIEPLAKEFTGKYLWLQAKKRNIAIKSFLMNHHVVVGIGNIYATEILFASGIHPLRSTKTLTRLHFDNLAKASKNILNKAIKKGGTTFKDFIKSDGKPGYFSQQLKVYGRAGLTCVKCHVMLTLVIINNRRTDYCPHCQL